MLSALLQGKHDWTEQLQYAGWFTAKCTRWKTLRKHRQQTWRLHEHLPRFSQWQCYSGLVVSVHFQVTLQNLTPMREKFNALVTRSYIFFSQAVVFCFSAILFWNVSCQKDKGESDWKIMSGENQASGFGDQRDSRTIVLWMKYEMYQCRFWCFLFCFCNP